MTLRGLSLPLLLVPAFVTGCIATKDMGQDDGTDANGPGSESSATTMQVPDDDAGTTMQIPDDDAGTTMQIPDDDASTTATIDGDDAGTTMATTDDGGLESTTNASGDDIDCEVTGGTWEPTSCGHYACGAPPACAAVIPGCDCGPTMNFVEGTGCVEDPVCLQATFDCGDLDCTVATEYCGVMHPGVQGAPTTYSCNALPAACAADPTCMCLDDEGVSGGPGQCTEVQGGGLQVETFAP